MPTADGTTTAATGSTTRHRAHATAHTRGVALCLSAAAGFALMAVVAKGAYAAGVSVTTLLALRFTLATGVLWAVVARIRPSRPAPGDALRGLGLGAVAYAAEAGLFFAALTRIDASLTALVTYAYPALVVAGAIALGRERPHRRRLGALVLASAGVALVVAGAGAGAADALGLVLAAGAAAAYAVYVLVSDRVVRRLEPLPLSALLTTGAATTFWLAGALTGTLDLGFGAGGWLAVAALALVSTVWPIAAFLASLPLVGPGTASVLSTVEPVITVALAVTLLGDDLAPAQALGGALVVGAAGLVALRATPRRPRRPRHGERRPAGAPRYEDRRSPPPPTGGAAGGRSGRAGAHPRPPRPRRPRPRGRERSDRLR